MSRYEHEFKIAGTTERLKVARNENGEPMYRVIPLIPNYRDPLEFLQESWIGGHGQYTMKDGDVYFEGENIDTTQDGVVFLGPLINEVKESDDTDLDSAPVAFLWYNNTSELLCATSGKIYRYNVGSNLKWTAATTVVANVTHLAEYNGVAYAACGTNTYYTSIDGDEWTACDLTDKTAQMFFSSPNADGTANVLWKTKHPNEIAETTDGTDGGTQYSTPAYIGDTSNNITSMFLVNDNLMIGKTDNLYHYDADGGVHPLMDSLKHNKSTNNFKYVAEWQTSILFSLGRGMGEITSYNAFTPMGPLTDVGEIGKVGDIVGLATDKDFFYVAVDEGTNTHIYKCREARREGKLRWEYCPWIKLGTKTCATMKVVQHSATDRRLWFGYTNSTGYVKLTDNPLADSNAEFNTAGGFIRMSYEYGTNPYWDELWQSIVVETTGCSSTVTVTPKYRKDIDTTATTITPAIKVNGVTRHNMNQEIASKRIQFELHFATGSSASTPQVTRFIARGIEKPEVVYTHEMMYTLGGEPTRRVKTLRDLFRAASKSTKLIRFADLRFGETTQSPSSDNFRYVVVEPGYPQEDEIVAEKGRQPEIGLRLKLREVNYT